MPTTGNDSTLPQWLIKINEKLDCAKVTLQTKEGEFKSSATSQKEGCYSTDVLLEEAGLSQGKYSVLWTTLQAKQLQYAADAKNNEANFRTKQLAYQDQLKKRDELRKDLIAELAKKQSNFVAAKEALVKKLHAEAIAELAKVQATNDPSQTTMGYFFSYIYTPTAKKSEEVANIFAPFLAKYGKLTKAIIAEAKQTVVVQSKEKVKNDNFELQLITLEELSQKTMPELWDIFDDAEKGIEFKSEKVGGGNLVERHVVTTLTPFNVNNAYSGGAQPLAVAPKQRYERLKDISQELKQTDFKADISDVALARLVENETPGSIKKLRDYQAAVESVQKTQTLVESGPMAASAKHLNRIALTPVVPVDDFKITVLDTSENSEHDKLIQEVDRCCRALANAKEHLGKKSEEYYKDLQSKKKACEAEAKEVSDGLRAAVTAFKNDTKSVENYDALVMRVKAAKKWAEEYQTKVNEVSALYGNAKQKFGVLRQIELVNFSNGMTAAYGAVAKSLRDADGLMVNHSEEINNKRKDSGQLRLFNMLMSAALNDSNRETWKGAVKVFSTHKIGEDRVPAGIAYLNTLYTGMLSKKMTVEACLIAAQKYVKERFDLGRPLSWVRTEFTRLFYDAWRGLDIKNLKKEQLDLLEQKLKSDTLKLDLTPLKDPDMNSPLPQNPVVAFRR